jgi:hypothetical protein
MRILVVAALASAALAAGCSSPCQELGDRLCNCRLSGVTKASCTDAVKADIQRLHPGSSADHVCSKVLDSCHTAKDIDFCDWIEGRCGKAACGMSQEEIATLQSTPVDDTVPACQTNPVGDTCAMICPK